jgi:hypothetical protein
MNVITNKSVLFILAVSLFISCHKKKDDMKPDIFILSEPFHMAKDTSLKVMLINNTSKNYFVTLDTTRTYDYSDFNPKTNSSFILKPLIFENDNFIYPELEGGVYKMDCINKGEEEWYKKESMKAETFLKDYVSLKNAIFLKRKSAKYLEFPFKLKYPYSYFLTNHYVLKKGKEYELQLEYQMLKEITEKLVKKNSLDSVKKLGYMPYYGKVTSNKVPIIIDKKPDRADMQKISRVR